MKRITNKKEAINALIRGKDNIYYIGEFRVGKETGQGVYYDESGNEIQTSTGEQSQQSSAA